MAYRFNSIYDALIIGDRSSIADHGGSLPKFFLVETPHQTRKGKKTRKQRRTQQRKDKVNALIKAPPVGPHCGDYPEGLVWRVEEEEATTFIYLERLGALGKRHVRRQPAAVCRLEVKVKVRRRRPSSRIHLRF